MNITAAVFDMDGLLIDSERIALRVFQEICDHYSLGEQFNLYLQVLGTNNVTTRQVLSDALPAAINPDTFMSRWLDRYTEETSKPVPLMKGVIPLLDFLDSCNIPKAVATSTDTDRALEKLEKTGILNRFSTVTGGDQVSRGKPAPDIYLKSAASISADPATCLALEDSPNGVKAALGAGMHTIQIPELVEPDEQLLAMGHIVLTDLHAVIDHLTRFRRTA